MTREEIEMQDASLTYVPLAGTPGVTFDVQCALRVATHENATAHPFTIDPAAQPADGSTIVEWNGNKYRITVEAL